MSCQANWSAVSPGGAEKSVRILGGVNALFVGRTGFTAVSETGNESYQTYRSVGYRYQVRTEPYRSVRREFQ